MRQYVNCDGIGRINLCIDMGNCQIKLQIGQNVVPASYRSNLSM